MRHKSPSTVKICDSRGSIGLMLFRVAGEEATPAGVFHRRIFAMGTVVALSADGCGRCFILLLDCFATSGPGEQGAPGRPRAKAPQKTIANSARTANGMERSFIVAGRASRWVYERRAYLE